MRHVRERVGEDELQSLRAGHVSVRLVVREDCDQAVRVPGRGREHDAAPGAVQRHDAELVVLGVPGCLQVLAWVRVPGEGGDRLVDGALDALIQPHVFRQEVLRDRQPSHLGMLRANTDIG